MPVQWMVFPRRILFLFVMLGTFVKDKLFLKHQMTTSSEDMEAVLQATIVRKDLQSLVLVLQGLFSTPLLTHNSLTVSLVPLANIVLKKACRLLR